MRTISLYLNAKNTFNIVLGVCVVCLAAIPLLVPTDELSWMRWKIIAGIIFVVAIVTFIVQGFSQSSEDAQRERREQERDKNFELVVNQLTEQTEQEQKNNDVAALPSKAALRDKVMQLGHDLFAFLREIGPKPESPIDHLRSTEENFRAVMAANGPYVEKVHYGYLRRFKQRAYDLFLELDEAHIPYQLESWEISPPQAMRAETVRKIAEQCFLIAAQMDISEVSKGT
jgi:hypothetical protein